MTATAATAATAATPTVTATTPTPATTRGQHRLLTAGVVAGPLYVAAVVGQYVVRDGYDPTRHAASVLANGDLGWVQIANFVVAAVLTVAAAAGLRRSGRAGTWAPRLVGVFGVSLLAAGVFRADPVEGFPPGTPAEAAETISWHGLAHMGAGLAGFTCFAIACFALGRHLRRTGRRGAARYSVASGSLILCGFVAVSASAGATWGVLAFTAGILAGWTWLAVTCARLARLPH
ncbi:DUF998 domain-containing protein [Jiangella sp. DSM 45060]|uniref:DUF998 domain-containing protein n=1 Tax=Jiangella sp. DSM 45060 TaxID=1798224 RepID=UPI0008798CC4|nr:DUF998 domain-containing protein [Jiangella sp. DSM 45060]SDS73734.1 Protein of unknown function [Jiangella sp. DSM 45060]